MLKWWCNCPTRAQDGGVQSKVYVNWKESILSGEPNHIQYRIVTEADDLSKSVQQAASGKCFERLLQIFKSSRYIFATLWVSSGIWRNSSPDPTIVVAAWPRGSHRWYGKCLYKCSTLLPLVIPWKDPAVKPGFLGSGPAVKPGFLGSGYKSYSCSGQGHEGCKYVSCQQPRLRFLLNWIEFGIWDLEKL
jgi:hypothetical protein